MKIKNFLLVYMLHVGMLFVYIMSERLAHVVLLLTLFRSFDAKTRALANGELKYPIWPQTVHKQSLPFDLPFFSSFNCTRKKLKKRQKLRLKSLWLFFSSSRECFGEVGSKRALYLQRPKLYCDKIWLWKNKRYKEAKRWGGERRVCSTIAARARRNTLRNANRCSSYRKFCRYRQRIFPKWSSKLLAIQIKSSFHVIWEALIPPNASAEGAKLLFGTLTVSFPPMLAFQCDSI